MKDVRTVVQQMFTPGTVACTIFCAGLGIIFAILCLTIGVGRAVLIAFFCLLGAFIGGVRDKKEFIRGIVNFFHRNENNY